MASWKKREYLTQHPHKAVARLDGTRNPVLPNWANHVLPCIAFSLTLQKCAWCAEAFCVSSGIDHGSLYSISPFYIRNVGLGSSAQGSTNTCMQSPVLTFTATFNNPGLLSCQCCCTFMGKRPKELLVMDRPVGFAKLPFGLRSPFKPLPHTVLLTRKYLPSTENPRALPKI